MIIQNSSIQMQSRRYYCSAQNNFNRLITWDNNRGTSSLSASADKQVTEEIEGNFSGEKPVLNDEQKQPQNDLQDAVKHFQTTHKATKTALEEKVKTLKQIQRETIHYLFRILFDKDARSIVPLTDFSADSSMNVSTDSSADVSTDSSSDSSADSSVGSSGDLGLGGTYSSFHYYSETETTSFNTTGTVVTADGRNLSFNISLEMSRSFTQMASTRIDFGTPRLCDPLVINLDTNIAEVSDQKFLFDIDADGEKESISMLNSASGYLAFDKNEDGIINDGSELFGTQSGNGFYDLLQYDKDGNGWIDEADEIFDKLKIWQMSEDGSSKLIDLKEAGIGAIYLGYEDTKFSLNNAQNQTNAVIQKTGLFLYENGYTGTVQQMDLAV